MTSKDHLPEVTILCEDVTHERFIRQYLICRGLEDRQIKDFGNPKGKAINNNNAFILKHYPALIKDYRKRKYRNIAVVVMIDADEDTISERMRSLNMTLNQEEGELNKDLRLPDEKVAIFVPARNIETWFEYIHHHAEEREWDERQDYKDQSMGLRDRIKFAQESAKILAKDICPHGVENIKLPSLCHACQELQRLQL